MTATPRPATENILNYLRANSDDIELALNCSMDELQPALDAVFKAVNTHDRAKAAIKAVLHEYDKASMFDANGSKFDELRAVLADMEG